MAPKKGGGGGYSDSSESSGSSVLVWVQDTVLFGSNFQNHYMLAQIVIHSICLVALIVTAIGSLTIKKRSQSVQALFRWFRFGTAMTMALV